MACEVIVGRRAGRLGQLCAALALRALAIALIAIWLAIPVGGRAADTAGGVESLSHVGPAGPVIAPAGTQLAEEEVPEEEEEEQDEPEVQTPSAEELLRRSQDLATPPSTPNVDEPPVSNEGSSSTTTRDNGLSTQIERLKTITREKPPEKTPGLAPPEQPPTYTPTPPPPTIYGEELEDEFCCGLKGTLLTYPIVRDPMELSKELEAPRAVASGGFQVLLHTGAYFHNELDMSVQAIALPVEWARHYKGKLKIEEGGAIGYGWDFSYNKRIVPIASRQLGNGLFAEQIGVETARLAYFNGQMRGELYVETHSERRQVRNFDTAFRAYVTTYKSPPGQFHEFERYVLLNGTHPFAKHPNVEKTEKIFYVMRDKNGTRYVFNCRGQNIYILSRNDSAQEPVRVELRYGGPRSPLTQNTMLSEMIDASGHRFSVMTTDINQGQLFTNVECKLVTGTAPIPRIKLVTGAGYQIQYYYKGNDSEPILEKVTVTTGDVTREWRYGYDGKNNLATLIDPNEAAKGDSGKPYLTNTYAGGKVSKQQLADMELTFNYQGSAVEVSDANGTAKRLETKVVSNFPVLSASTIKGDGKSWTTKYEHNGSTQITRITYPKGNGVAYAYDEGNDPVVLGPIRDWVEKGLTYENDLTLGNLVAVTLLSAGGGGGSTVSKGSSITTSQTYEKLYNQLESSTDALGNVTSYKYDYDAPRNRGNPLSVSEPAILQPDGGKVARNVTKYKYNKKGQRIETNLGDKRITKYDFAADGYLRSITYPSGATAVFKVDGRGNVLQETTPEGVVKYERDGRGLIKGRIMDPDGADVAVRYEYDLNGNVTETTTTIKDTFEDAAAGKRGLGKVKLIERVLKSQYDIINRLTEQRVTAGGLESVKSYVYDKTGAVEQITAPELAADAPFVTKYTYDARGLVAEQTEAAGAPAEMTTKFEYDDNGNQISLTQGSGAGTISQSSEYDGFDRVSKLTGPDGTEQVPSYDAAGNVIALEITGVVDIEGNKDVIYRVGSEHDAYGNVIRKSVDTLRGEVQETKTFRNKHLQVEKIVGPNGGEITYEYDLDNHVVLTVDPLGNRMKSTYDAKGSLTQTEQTSTEQVFDASKGSYTAKKSTSVTKMTYNSLGQVVTVDTPNLSQELFYNSASQIRGIWSKGEGLVNYEYDGLGRRTLQNSESDFERRQYTLGGVVKEVQTRKTHLVYVLDAFGRAVELQDKKAGTVTKTKYDVLGRAIEVVDPNKTTVTRTYTATGQVKSADVNWVGDRVVEGGEIRVPIVSGVGREDYTYDGLGRVLRAKTDTGSDVRFVYDGAGRVIEEIQAFRGIGQTITHSYSEDGTSDELQYPELANRAILRRHFDKLGRITKIEFNDEMVASYLYTGLDRIARKTYGNLIDTRFEYDALNRLTAMVTAHQFGGPAGKTLLTERAEYDGAWAKQVSQSLQPSAEHPGWLLKTLLKRAPDHAVISSVTTHSTLAAGDTPAGGSKSGAFSTYAEGRLSQMGEFVADDYSSILASARVDTFQYDGNGRVASVSTKGEVGINQPETGAATADELKSFLDGRGKALTGTQSFLYDANGNTLSDGRFIFSYDYRNRLIRVADTLAPYRYHESLFFYYDAFDRRVFAMPYRDHVPNGFVRWGPEWSNASTWFLYNQDAVIAEVWMHHSKAKRPTTLLAIYMMGGRAGERIRMDRKPEEDPNAALVTHYLHEDIQGGLKLASDTGGRLRFVRDEDPGTGGGGSADRPPYDRLMIEGSMVRLPYVGGSTRVDGFAAVTYREDAALTIVDFRRAYQFAKRVDRKVMREAIASYQNRMLAVLGIAAAAPFVLPYAIIYSPVVIKGAVLGGVLSVGFNAYAAYRTQSGYSLEEAAGNFARGAVAGALGGMVSAFGLGIVQELAVDYVIAVSSDTLIDVAWNGGSFGDTLSQNAGSGVKDALFGFAVGRLAGGLNSLGTRLSLSMQRKGVTMRSQGPRSEAIDPTKGLWSRWVSYASDVMRWVDHHMRTDVHPRSAEQRMLEANILYELLNGTPLSKEIGRRLASGEMELRFSKFGDPTTYGEVHTLLSRTIIHINIEAMPRNKRGGWHSRQVAGTVVHEGMHLLGGGELSAHIAQAQFLDVRMRSSSKPPRGIDVSRRDAPYFDDYHLDFINNYRRSSDVLVDTALFISHYKPHKVPLPLEVKPDDWIAGKGGFATVLGMQNNELFGILEARANIEGMR